MSHLDAEANMGHLGGSMTLHYTHPDLERRRVAVEELSRLIAEPVGVNGSKQEFPQNFSALPAKGQLHL